MTNVVYYKDKNIWTKYLGNNIFENVDTIDNLHPKIMFYTQNIMNNNNQININHNLNNNFNKKNIGDIKGNIMNQVNGNNHFNMNNNVVINNMDA